MKRLSLLILLITICSIATFIKPEQLLADKPVAVPLYALVSKANYCSPKVPETADTPAQQAYIVDRVKKMESLEVVIQQNTRNHVDNTDIQRQYDALNLQYANAVRAYDTCKAIDL